MLALDRCAFGAAYAAPGRPQPANANSGLSSARANRIGVLRASCRRIRKTKSQARRNSSLAGAMPPMRASDVADIRDWRAAELRRARHPPTRPNDLALAVRPIADDGRELVREDSWKQRQVAGAIMRRAKPIADRGLAFGQTVKVAHSGTHTAPGASRPQNSFLLVLTVAARYVAPCPTNARPPRRPTRVHRPGADERRPVGESAVGRTRWRRSTLCA